MVRLQAAVKLGPTDTQKLLFGLPAQVLGSDYTDLVKLADSPYLAYNKS